MEDMWEMRMSPLAFMTMRKFLSLAATVIAASFAWVLLVALPASAVDGTWKGDAILYDGNQYQSAGAADGTESHKIPKGSQLYVYMAPKSDGTSTAYIMYFPEGTKPDTAKAAKLVAYDFEPPNTYSNPSETTDVTLKTKAESGADNASACVVEGIGWIICPVTNFLAEAMDWIFNILANFLAVRPLQTSTDNALYRAWSFMRDLANGAFVIGFLIIIYSQLTSTGISNYGIKRTLPRLIIAAILVNVSYWVCAIMIDLSNIAGYGIQNFFMGMRDQITNGQQNSWDIVSWKSTSTAILSGGTLAAGAITGLISVGSVVGAIYYLLPILVGVLLAALVAMIIMAARQAIITILVIISPLAFVAFLLPNTEKYFDKFRGIFTTMLLLFPIFAVLFGGSQVAGIAIIQNADTIIMVILGMAVQVAPLVILPFLIKFGGSILGKVGGMVNDRSKGLKDRTSQFAKDTAAARKSQVLANPNLRRRNLLGRSVQGLDQRRRRREGWQKVNEAMADNKWMESEDFHRIDTANREADRLKKTIESRHDTEWNVRANVDPRSLEKELKLRIANDELEAAKARLDTTHAEFKTFDTSKYTDAQGRLTGDAPDILRRNPTLTAIANQAHSTAEDIALTGMRKEAADHTRRQSVANTLLTHEQARQYAGGVRGEEGKESAFAHAIKIEREEYVKNIKAKSELMKHFNLDASEYQKLALGEAPVTRTDTRGHTYTFNLNDEFTREAAIGRQLSSGSFGEIEKIIMESGNEYDASGNVVRVGKVAEFATSVSSAIIENKLQNKAGFFGSQTINDVAQGRIYGDAGLDNAAVRYIQGGKVQADDLSSMNAGAIKRLFKVANQSDAEILSMPHMAKEMAVDPTTGLPKKTSSQVLREYRSNSAALTDAATRILDTDLLSRNADKAALEALREGLRSSNL